MRIHEAISRSLQQHGVSLRSIAAATGLADSQVSYFLSGQRGMDYKNISILIEALPDGVYQEFCRLMSGDPQALEVEQAIAFTQKSMQIHEALAEALKRHKISARSIALSAGLAESQVSLFLNGQRGMDYKNISAFMGALPAVTYQEFCRLMSGNSQVATVDAAIAILATAPLTDEQIASLLSIASQCLRQTPAQNRERLPVVA